MWNVCVILAATLLLAQDDTGRLTRLRGTVQGPSQASLTLTGTSMKDFALSTGTHDDGSFVFTGLKADTYVLRVSADGFAGYTTTVRLRHEPELELPPIRMSTLPGQSTGNQLRALSVAIFALIAIAAIGAVQRRTPLALKASGTLIAMALLTGGIYSAVAHSNRVPFVPAFLLVAGIACFVVWSVPVVAALIKPQGNDVDLSKSEPPTVRS